MKRWPSLKSVFLVWGVLTGIAYVAYVSYLHGLPPDELVMANDLSFQATIGLIVVGLPATVLLVLFLAIGAIAKRWLVERASSAAEYKRVV